MIRITSETVTLTVSPRGPHGPTYTATAIPAHQAQALKARLQAVLTEACHHMAAEGDLTLVAPHDQNGSYDRSGRRVPRTFD